MASLDAPTTAPADAGAAVVVYLGAGLQTKRPEFTSIIREAIAGTANVDLVMAPDCFPAGARQVVAVGRPELYASEEFRGLVQKHGNVVACVQLFAGVSPLARKAFLAHPQLAKIPYFNLHHNAECTSEMAITLMLTLCRRVVYQHQRLREDRAWLLIVGYGHIGKRVAACARTLGAAEVMACRRRLPEGTEGDSYIDDFGVNVFGIRSLHTVLPQAQLLVLCAPGTSETSGLIGEPELALLPRGCHIINVGRSDIIDEDALWAWVREDDGARGSFASDVWWKEPPFRQLQQHPIGQLGKYDWTSLSNVVCSGHSGGGMGMEFSEKQRTKHCMRIVEAALGKRAWPTPVNLEAGY